MMELENSSPTAVSTASGEASASTVTAAKKKRNLPGTPDPDAEVIALSPKALMATNRFVCEICSKGFQRDQNLQLHRRGHNLPWKLKQRANKEIRKKVYVCPETTCVHHDPRRALGDLTGIKKHFCRKHGEKKWKCERCSKTYAVLSDWKAHMKTCGTKEYRCDCGTLFSRKDSFVTHRAFCDALAQESARAQPVAIADSEGAQDVQTLASPPSSPPPPPLTPSTVVLSPVLSVQSSEVPENQAERGQKQPVAAGLNTTTASTSSTSSGNRANSSGGGGSGVFASIFASAASSSPAGHVRISQSPSSFSDMLCAMAGPERHRPVEQPMSLSLSSSPYLSNNPPSLFSTTNHTPYGPTQQPALSATALLQKAAQIGATGSSSSFLRALGLEPSSMANQNTTASTPATSIATAPLWNGRIQAESNSVASGLGLGLPTGGASGLTDLIYANNNPTVDFLGLGIGGGGASSGGFSALLTSIGGGLEVSTATGAAASFGRVNSDDQSERKPSSLL